MGSPSAHAVLSPSSAKRWMACTPSARFEEQFENVETVFAQEGTLAHAISELILKHRLGKIAQFDEHLDSCKQHELYTPEMLTHAEQYADYCMLEVHKDSIAEVEARLDITAFIPEGFGTGDFLSYTPSLKRLAFRDLKYGKGVAVSAIDNTQLKIYALGALLWYRWVYGDDVEIEMISVGIYQPRINNNSEWEISVTDLIHWAETELKPAADLAFKGAGAYQPGEHCKFCRARVKCKALADHNLDLFKHELKSHDQLSDADLLDIVKRGGLLADWVKDISEYVTSEAVKGKKWAGMKLVEGKSNRVFVSESMTEKKLLEAGFKEIYTPAVLLGVTGLTKVLGAKVFKELVEPDLRKPPGKPTLVSVDDPRKEFDNAQSVFKDAAIREEISE